MDTCQNYREMISAFIDGELAGTDRAALMEHMAACPACQGYFDDQIALHDAMGRLDARAPEDLAERVMAQVRLTAQEEPEPVRKSKRIAFPGWRQWTALAACFAVVVVGLWAFGGGFSQQPDAAQYALRTTHGEGELPAPASTEAEELPAARTPAPQAETALDGESRGVVLAEETWATVTVISLEGDGFAARVAEPDPMEILQTEETVQVMLEPETEILLPDGGVSAWGTASGDGTAGGIVEGTRVRIAFSTYENEPRLRVYALRVEPAEG